MKRCFIVMIGTFFLMTAGTFASANTVSVILGDVGDLDISGFQLFFDDALAFPGESDVAVNWDTGQSGSWLTYTLLTDDGNVDGILAFDDLYDASESLVDGLVLSLTSDAYDFGIDIENAENAFWDYTGNWGEVIDGLTLTELWDNGDQVVNVSAAAVPIPSTLLLFGGGLAGLVGIRRNLQG